MNEKIIISNWERLIKLIEDTFSDNRKKKLISMYNHFKERMMFTPASGQIHFHNCHPGGYVEHVLNIVRYAKEIKDLWYNNGAYTEDYTEEELVFAAMHHDLGKVGDLNSDYYIPNPSEWHRKNQGKIYTHNPELEFMNVADRSIWILNQFNITMSANEMLAIKLADGMYDDANIQYLKTYSPEKKLKSNLPHIIHQADMMTTRIEYEEWVDRPAKKSKSNKHDADSLDVNELKSEFDKLFA